MKLLAGMLLIALAAPAGAQERERIHAERAQVEARYTAAEHECEQRFLVTACVDEAQTERRKALAELRKQELVLDKAERAQKAAERTEEIRAKAEAASAPPTSRAAESAASGERPAPSREAGQARQPKPVPPPLTPEEIAVNRARYEQRQIDADQHRADVERRNQQRAAEKKKPSQPLPVLPAGSAP